MTASAPFPLTLRFELDGLHCAACVGRVERALAVVPGVVGAAVNLATSTAQFTAVTPAAVTGAVAALDAAGYPALRETVDLRIDEMHCAACVGRVERALAAVPGVLAARVNLATSTARATVLRGAGSAAALIAALAQAGYPAHPLAETAADTVAKPSPLRWALPLTVLLAAPMFGHPFGAHWAWPAWLQAAMAAPIQFVAGAGFYRRAWAALRARTGTMDLLVALGTSAAFGLSLALWLRGAAAAQLYFESSAVVITLVLLGKTLEAHAKRQTAGALRALQALHPDSAHQLVAGVERDVPIVTLTTGDRVVVRPGERIPVDGTIVDGTTDIDESMLTGESVLQAKTIGAAVAGGTINGLGRIVVATTKTGGETLLAQIIRLVEDAQMAKAPIQTLVDRVSAVFVPAVLVAAAATLAGWLLAGATASAALLNAVAVLVIACPCALGLATPAALVAGIGAGARYGILIRDAAALEAACKTRVVAFDKTGTLTVGKPQLLRCVPKTGFTSADALTHAAALQTGSEHPLASAVLDAAAGAALPAVTGITALPGLGIAGTIGDVVWRLGNHRLLDGVAVSPELAAAAAAEQAAGHTVSWLIAMSPVPTVAALLTFGDVVRPTAAAAIARLRAMGLRTLMLSGDNRGAAAAIAAQTGIDEYAAELLPADKVAQLRLRQQAAVVAMVGDGINDAPALAAADLGIAMASGTDVAMQAAPITLMHGDLLRVADALALSRRTVTTIRQNLFWAFCYNVAGIGLAALGKLNPMLAGAAMAFSSVCVVTNALRLLRWRPQRPAMPQ